MNEKQRIERSLKAINKEGALLVYPVKNAKEPHSIWSSLYPRTQMEWSWDGTASDKIGHVWLLMKTLSDCRKVIYSKWYQDRATFFSIDMFKALLVLQREEEPQQKPLSHEAKQILEILEMDSPLSTKQLKAMSELQGRLYAGIFNRSLRELFHRFLIVGYGEVEDGVFPSAAVGATKTLYEELYLEAQEMSVDEAHKIIDKYMPASSKFRSFLKRSFSKMQKENT